MLVWKTILLIILGKCKRKNTALVSKHTTSVFNLITKIFVPDSTKVTVNPFTTGKERNFYLCQWTEVIMYLPFISTI